MRTTIRDRFHCGFDVTRYPNLITDGSVIDSYQGGGAEPSTFVTAIPELNTPPPVFFTLEGVMINPIRVPPYALSGRNCSLMNIINND